MIFCCFYQADAGEEKDQAHDKRHRGRKFANGHTIAAHHESVRSPDDPDDA